MVPQIFEYDSANVRVLEMNKEFLFHGNDCASILGFMDPNDAVRNHCKHRKLVRPGDAPGLNLNNRGEYFVPEGNLYRLVMRSNLPDAEKFQDWVCDDVLPSIRKTGSYSTIQQLPEYIPLSDRAEALKILASMPGDSYTEMAIRESMVALAQEATYAIPKVIAPISGLIGDESDETGPIFQIEDLRGELDKRITHKTWSRFRGEFGKKVKAAIIADDPDYQIDMHWGTKYINGNTRSCKAYPIRFREVAKEAMNTYANSNPEI